MSYQLRAGLHFCESGDRMIFLDLAADRYFALPAEAEQAFRSLIGRLPGSSDIATVERLKRLNLLVNHPSAVAPIACPDRRAATASAVEERSLATSSSRWHLRSAAALLRAEMTVRMSPLEATISALIRKKRNARRRGNYEAELAIAVNAFDHMSRWLSARDRCLPRSIALARILYARSIPADLIIGVVARPFRAHCWVENDGVVLNDRLENVQNYAPILVV